MSSRPLEEQGLKATEVNSIFFLQKLKGFEEKYKRAYGWDWAEFLGIYRSFGSDQTKLDAYPPDQQHEFAEWSFLCEIFMKDLIEYEGEKDKPLPDRRRINEKHESPADAGLSYLHLRLRV